MIYIYSIPKERTCTVATIHSWETYLVTLLPLLESFQFLMVHTNLFPKTLMFQAAFKESVGDPVI